MPIQTVEDIRRELNERAPFRDRLHATVVDAALTGLRWAIIITLIGGFFLLLADDYRSTRANAAWAAGYLRQVLAQQEAAKAAPAK
jgi:hypothetical protein